MKQREKCWIKRETPRFNHIGTWINLQKLYSNNFDIFPSTKRCEFLFQSQHYLDHCWPRCIISWCLGINKYIFTTVVVFLTWYTLRKSADVQYRHINIDWYNTYQEEVRLSCSSAYFICYLRACIRSLIGWWNPVRWSYKHTTDW